MCGGQFLMGLLRGEAAVFVLFFEPVFILQSICLEQALEVPAFDLFVACFRICMFEWGALIVEQPSIPCEVMGSIEFLSGLVVILVKLHKSLLCGWHLAREASFGSQQLTFGD